MFNWLTNWWQKEIEKAKTTYSTERSKLSMSMYSNISTENMIQAHLNNVEAIRLYHQRMVDLRTKEEEEQFLEYCKTYHPTITKERLDRMKAYL